MGRTQLLSSRNGSIPYLSKVLNLDFQSLYPGLPDSKQECVWTHLKSSHAGLPCVISGNGLSLRSYLEPEGLGLSSISVARREAIATRVILAWKTRVHLFIRVAQRLEQAPYKGSIQVQLLAWIPKKGNVKALLIGLNGLDRRWARTPRLLCVIGLNTQYIKAF